MCGRYLIEDEAYADILQILNDLNSAYKSNGFARGEAAWDGFARGEVFPTNVAPVIAGGSVAAVKWGFPHWKNSGVIINARAETALEKKMFGKPLRERRCVVPSSGFFEWSRNGGSGGDVGGSGGGKKKDKFLLQRPGDSMLYMAGMVNTFRDAFGEEYNAFVILTTAANEYVAPIHDRMPVILSADEVDLWARDDDFMEFALFRAGPELSAVAAV